AILGELTPSARLRAVAGALLEAVRGGTSLGDALAQHSPRPFSRLYVNMVRAGEKGGVLDATLKRLAEYLEESQALRDTVASALIYPALLSPVGAAAVVFLLAFVIPRFADIFKDLGGAIPLPTQILLQVSGGLQRFWWVLAILALGASIGARLALTLPGARLAVDQLVLRLPLVGEVVRKGETARFARILGTLLRSGVPLIGALTVVKEMLASQPLARAADSLADGVRRGAGLHQPMAAAKVFPALAVHMVRVGEETGRLEEVLLKGGADLEGDTRRRLTRLVALAEPVIILVMGLLVGFIVLAMLPAIFSISELPVGAAATSAPPWGTAAASPWWSCWSSSSSSACSPASWARDSSDAWASPVRPPRAPRSSFWARPSINTAWTSAPIRPLQWGWPRAARTPPSP